MTEPLPAEVWILGHRFVISHDVSEHTKALWKRLGLPEPTEEDCYPRATATIDFRGDWIFVSPSTGLSESREVLLHEIMHGVDRFLHDDRLSRGEKRHLTTCDKCIAKTEPVYLCEQVILTMSRGLFATLTDPRNVAVRDFIFGTNTQ